MPNLTFGEVDCRSCSKQPVGSFDKLLQHVNRTRGTALKAVNAPEKLSLSLRGGFTLAARNRMHVRADSITAFRFMTAILQVLEGIAWP